MGTQHCALSHPQAHSLGGISATYKPPPFRLINKQGRLLFPGLSWGPTATMIISGLLSRGACYPRIISVVYPGVELGHRSVTRRRATSCNVIGSESATLLHHGTLRASRVDITLADVQAHNKNMCDMIVILYPNLLQVG